MSTRPRWIAKVLPYVPFFVALVASPALARIGGGESFDSGNRSSDSGGDAGFLIDILVWLIISHPQVGIPLAVVVAIAWFVVKKSTDGGASTRKAIDRAEAQRRTSVSAAAVDGWVAALTAKDAGFSLLPFLDQVKARFLTLQDAWARRDLEPVRRYLSDGTFQRLVVQLRLLDVLGVRDAIAEPVVLDLALIGLEQGEGFDSVHVRVTAQLRDAEAPASASDDEARALALKAAPERFTEVWTFVRRPGAQTKTDPEQAQGACPNCGAPFTGGASNTCEHCGAIVNSGSYDWVLAEITQASVFSPSHETADGVSKLRQADPGFTTQVLEDRAALLFWRWIEAQVLADPSRLAKVATPAFVAELQQAVGALDAQGRRKRFFDCALGAVDTRRLSVDGEQQVAAVELRWSAKAAVGPKDAPGTPGASQPQRSVLVLQRRAGARSSEKHGLATNRCLNCSAPLTDNGQPSCEYCGALLAGGEADWVVRELISWERWLSNGGARAAERPAPVAARVPDREERERLVYLMAAMARADGVVDKKERELLRMAAERWSVPWANVELALGAGDGLFDKLIARGSVEAQSFMRELLAVALIDGRIDKKERKLLEAAARHLGVDPAVIDGRAPREPGHGDRG